MLSEPVFNGNEELDITFSSFPFFVHQHDSKESIRDKKRHNKNLILTHHLPNLPSKSIPEHLHNKRMAGRGSH